ncbi:MAG: pyridoxamine 5'-phosphate oxidase family protein [Ferruginibacter sp.]
MLGTLSDTQIYNVLSSQSLGRLACTDGLQPYIIPITYVYDGQYIYAQSKKGLKLKLLRKNSNVCFEVDMMTDMNNWKCVLVYGKFEEPDEKKAGEARQKLYDGVFSLMTGSAVHAHEHAVTDQIDDSNRIKEIVYRIKIEKITGRFAMEQ